MSTRQLSSLRLHKNKKLAMKEHSILLWSAKKSSWCCCIFKGIFRGHNENNDADT